ncbi:hypothetical protein [Actinomadura sp. WMMA1423]|uniref:hypothetical protein n=1 Tax=Actinomadura sp. WMMA1423 TaxID=2591108 RepID=UPI0011468238|nr:hypothetical protein [Actinomadura sp. WMMA1423]
MMTGEFRPNITGTHKQALQVLAFGSEESWDACASKLLENDEDIHGFSALLAFSLGTLVRRKFPPPWSLRDIIQYVAGQRVKLGEDAAELNPRLTENIIRFLLGDASLEDPPHIGASSEEFTSTQMALWLLLAKEARLDEAGVDELVNEASTNARNADWSLVTFPSPLE